MLSEPGLDQPFLIGPQGQRWSFASAHASAAWLARELRGSTRARPATISLVLHDRLLLAQWVVAGLLSGVTVNPINPDLTPSQIEAVLKAAETDFVVSERPELGSLSVPLWSPMVLGEDLAATAAQSLSGSLLIFTSGTTGRPKGVLLGSKQLRANVEIAIEAFGYDAEWVTASVLPLFHTFTIVSDLLPMLQVRGRCVIAEGFSVASIAATSSLMQDWSVQSFSGVPIVLRLLARFANPRSLTSLRFAIAGAAPLPESVRLAYQDSLGHPILPCYGMSESSCFISVSTVDNIRAHAVGRPAPGIELIVLRGDDDRGEIAIRGDSVIADGYFRFTREENAAFYQDGYLLTGDVGRLDEDGYLHITGRKKNMLIKGGEKYYLEDIDRALIERHDLIDCASVVLLAGEQDDDYITFAVHPNGGAAADSASLRESIVALFGPRAAPRRIEFLPEIPRSPTGKVRIAELVARATA